MTDNNPPITFLKKPLKAVATLDHREIGILYFLFAMINLAVAGIFILVVRAELFPGVDFINKGEVYNSLFSTHGVLMIFFVVMPMGAGFGNYLVPKMIGAKDLYWPKWNNVAFWMLVPAAVLVYTGFSGVGWTFYPPLSTQVARVDSVNSTIIGALLAGTSSVIGALNFLLTILYLRRPDLSLIDMDLFSWSIVFTSLLQFVTTPFITTAFVLILLSNTTGATFFLLNSGSGPILYQHIFWSYSHPAVYIMILPSMGLTSVIFERFSQRKIFGHTGMIISLGAISLLGVIVWGHHMFTVAIGTQQNWIFTFLTFVIAIPSGIKTFNWIFTLQGGEIKTEPPFIYAVGFVIGFVMGGFSGVMVNSIPIDIVYHDTYFVVGHFHYIIIGGALSTIIGAIYYLFPDVTGKMYDKKLATIQAYIWIFAYNLTFFAMNMAGFFGMPRRYMRYDGLPMQGQLQLWNALATIGAFLQGITFLMLAYNLVKSGLKGEAAGENPYGLKNPNMWDLEEAEKHE